MSRPLKYIEGPVIKTIAELADHISAGRYIINRQTKQRIHPGWACSWQFRMCLDGIKRRAFAQALRNPDHPDNKEMS